MRDQLEKGEKLILQGRTGQAQAVFREILRQDPSCGEAMNNLGVIHMHHGDVAAAETYFVQASEIRPDCKSVWLNLAALHRQQQRWERVAEDLEAYIRLDDANAVAWNQRGLARLRLGDVPAARQALRRSLEINADQHVIRETLAQLDRDASVPGLAPGATGEPESADPTQAHRGTCDPPLSVLLACDQADPRDLALARALARRGFRVRLAAREHRQTPPDGLVEATTIRDERHFWDLAARCDLVHARDDQLAALAMAGETPVVHDARPAPPACPSPANRTARALALRGADGRIFSSPQDQTEAQAAFGPLGPCAVLPAPAEPDDVSGQTGQADHPRDAADAMLDALAAFYRQVLDAAADRSGHAASGERPADAAEVPASKALDRALDGLVAWLDRTGLEGHDAADLLGHLARQGERLAPADAARLLSRASSDPIGVRAELGVQAHRSPEAVAMALAGFLRLHLLRGERQYLDRAVSLGEELHAAACVDEEGRLAWSLPFDRPGPAGVPAEAPCASVTVTVAEALADLHEATGEARHRQAVQNACRFLVERLAVETDDGGVSFAPAPRGEEGEPVLDLYCAELLVRVGRRWGDEACLDTARRATRRVVGAQREDGSIPARPDEAGDEGHPQTSPLAEATAVAALLDLGELLDDDAVRLAAARALARFLDARVTCDGVPTGGATRLTDCARAAEMLARAASEHAPLLDRAESHVRWMIDRLGKDDGHFAHRVASGRVEDGPFVTDQAAALRAIAEVRAVRAAGERGEAGRSSDADGRSGERDSPALASRQLDGTYHRDDEASFDPVRTAAREEGRSPATPDRPGADGGA